MRKLILSMFISLDGYIAGPGGEFIQPPWSDEVAREWSGWAGENGGHLLFGRVNFEQMRDFWTSDDAKDLPETGFMNALPKTALSRTLSGDIGWNGRATADLAGEVARLKAEGGKDVLCFGGAGVSHALVAQDLADEYRLMIAPMLFGGGLSLFPEGVRRDLELVESQTLDVGSLIVRYAKKP